MTIAERIRYLRKNYLGKMSMREFGEKIGLTVPMVQNLEDETRLKKGIPDRIIKLIAKTYNVNYEWLKYGKGEIETRKIENKSRLEDICKNESPYFIALVKIAIEIWNDEQWEKFKNAVDQIKKEALQ